MNIYALIESNNADNLQKIAATFSQDDGTKRLYTYQELFDGVNQFTDNLRASHIASGDRVALVAENGPEWNIAYLGILKLNATAVLIDASLPADDILKLIEHSDVRGLYTSPKLLIKLTGHLKTAIPVFNIMGQGSVFPGFHDQLPETLPPTSDGDPRIATIIFSSGTTRSAMGIMHTHDALVKSTMMCATSNQLDQQGRYLSVIPSSHIYGLVCLVLAPLLLGADSFYIESMTAPTIKMAFDSYKPTIFPCVPKVFDMFKNQALMTINSKRLTQIMYKLLFPLCLALRKKFGFNLGKAVFKSIHQAFGGKIDILCSAGAPISQETANFYIGTGFNLLITYGATETNIPSIGNRGKNLTADTCGTPYEDVQVKLSDSGEILIQSPYMMKGYFRDPQATAEAFVDGWLKTGDLGVQDARGNYRIIGRSKENIVLGTGKKLTPEDVEAAYQGLIGVAELVVAGVPTAAGYDDIHAFIVRDQSQLPEEQILEHLAAKTREAASHMRLAKIHFVTEIPKTSLQKPKRYLLKKTALANQLPTDLQVEKRDTRPNVAKTVIRLIAELGELEEHRITLTSKPFSELGVDSLAAINLASELEDRYKLNVESLFTPEMTVGSLVAYLLNPQEQEGQLKKNTLRAVPKVKNKIDYILFKSACLLARLFYKITVSNQQQIPKDSGYIICANHVSNLDYLWLTINFKKEQFHKFYCLAKEEVVNQTAISQLLTRVCGMIPVNRSQTDSEALIHCKNKLNNQHGLLIHPEGTRSKNGQLGPLKKGAAVLAIDSDVPIIPAYIHGAYDIYPRSQKLPNWFNFSTMGKYSVKILYGQPIIPTGLTPKELTKQVETAMIALALQQA